MQPAYGITNFGLQLTPQRLEHLSVSLFCNNAFDRHYAANLANVRGNWTFPSSAGTAYTHELPCDHDRFFGLRVAYSSY